MKNQLQRLAAAAALGLAGFAANAASTIVDVSGAQSINLLGEAGNTVWLVDIGAGSSLNSLSWNVMLNALDPSTLSDLQVSFGNSGGLDLVTLSPGVADPFSGQRSYAGSTDLAPLGLAVGAAGLLRIEFSEGYKDFLAGTTEGQWVSGNLTFDVTAAAIPEPASAALMLLGLGLVGAQLRRASGRRSPAIAGSC
ncbi:hypothetical protein BH11PSE10_BH11PSE10_11050 [soil metagenome]